MTAEPLRIEFVEVIISQVVILQLGILQQVIDDLQQGMVEQFFVKLYTGTADGSKNRFHVSGKLSAGKAHGKFSLKATGRASDGTKLSCKTGKLSWSAQRQK